MSRFTQSVVVLAMALFTLSLSAQKDPNSIEGYFTGKEVVLKIDMPGTQQGVDLRYNKDVPMNWKEYSSRLKKQRRSDSERRHRPGYSGGGQG